MTRQGARNVSVDVVHQQSPGQQEVAAEQQPRARVDEHQVIGMMSRRGSDFDAPIAQFELRPALRPILQPEKFAHALAVDGHHGGVRQRRERGVARAMILVAMCVGHHQWQARLVGLHQVLRHQVGELCRQVRIFRGATVEKQRASVPINR